VKRGRFPWGVGQKGWKLDFSVVLIFSDAGRVIIDGCSEFDF
jgi:hypothetical protein